MPDQDRSQRLADFVSWADQHITGDEKGQAQIFLDRFFRAFGHDGLLEAGGHAEVRIRKATEDGGGTAFADCVWKPHVLIEMKRRGVDLARHYRQAFDYWTRLVPGRPHYVILCNFDQFHVYDFDTQLDTPVDTIAIHDLPKRYGPLAFLFPTHEAPVFGNDNEKVTREAAARLAVLFNKLKVRKDVGRETAQRFVLQLLVALFAEDIGLLDRYTIQHLADDCKTPADAFDLFGGLFEAMNAPQPRTGGRFKGVRYFNGGIFQHPAHVELHEDELAQINHAANEDWSKVRPEIFGTIFEQTCDQDERHAFGAHFTSAGDIMKIVRPTITEPWEQLIDRADSIKRLRELHQRMQSYRVLDPACGSGNFLYLAYRELKRLEKRLTDKLAELSRRQRAAQMQFSFVTTRQFFGIDINPFAVELAKVTMMLAHKLAIDELHSDEPALPLDNLDANIRCADALITWPDDPQIENHQSKIKNPIPTPTPWPQADAIIGNPPFLGAKRLKPERGPDYVNAVRKLYPEVPGMADYCVYWLRRAYDRLNHCTPDDPVTGRAGLVGTQNIRNNKSREGGLDHIAASATIVEAVDNQPWSGEANVHVSIANWVKHPTPPPSNPPLPQPPAPPGDLLIPEKKKLWFKVHTLPGSAKPRKPGDGSAQKVYELDYRECDHINPALSDEADVSQASALACNTKPQRSFQGVVPGYDGFALTHQQRRDLLKADPRNANVVRPWLIGRDLLTGTGAPSRAIIDFAARDLLEARRFPAPFEIAQRSVLPAVAETARRTKGGMKAAREEHLQRWWQYWNVRSEMRAAFAGIERYLACSRVTKRPIFAFVSTEIVPDGALQVWALDDDYSFGILHSAAHWQWFVAKCSKLKSDFRYTRRSVWDTFPWPQSPSASDVDAVAEAGREVRRVRDSALTKIKGGLRALYRTLELPGRDPLKDAHADLDAAVLNAYGFSPRKDLLQQLLDLNLHVAQRIQQNQPVLPPGIPPNYPNPDHLITPDRITAPNP